MRLKITRLLLTVAFSISLLLGMLSYLYNEKKKTEMLQSLVQASDFGKKHNEANVDKHKKENPASPILKRQIKEKVFKIVKPFNFPQPTYSRSPYRLLHSAWVKELQKYLKSVNGNEISVVTSTVEHMDVLMNWLIAAYIKITEPLENIMVISMDKVVHDTLVERGIPSLFVHKDMVIKPKAGVERVFSQVHIVRLAVLRLMNHYGYDLINYDCDAVPLKNPQPIFDEYKTTDLIGTFGKGPHFLYEKWGVTLNTGVMVMRATPEMEAFWKQMPYGKDPPLTDDQNSINYCLDHMGVKWTNYNSSEKIEHRDENILGEVPIFDKNKKRKSSLHVMLMPYTTVCRHVCNVSKRDGYYVWHPPVIGHNRTVANKKKQASLGGAWHLRDDWKEFSDKNTQLKGREWLSYISKSDRKVR